MSKLTKPVSASDHVLGSEDARVTLVEYGDFECPYCGAAYPITSQIIHKMGDQLRFVFRQFPLTEVHPYALAAAEASEAAAAQGKFWEMVDMIYRNQDELDNEHLYDFANAIGLDMKRFKHDMQDHTYEGKVQEDFMSGVRSGVNGTPSFFINGRQYEGPVDIDAMTQALQGAAQVAQT